MQDTYMHYVQNIEYLKAKGLWYTKFLLGLKGYLQFVESFQF
jgi:hypothetical protein